MDQNHLAALNGTGSNAPITEEGGAQPRKLGLTPLPGQAIEKKIASMESMRSMLA